MLPLVLLGCAWWQRGRVTRKDVLRALPFFALAGALAAVELWFHSHHVLTHIAARPEGFLSRAAAAGWAVWFYLYKAVLPWNLAMVYPRWNVDPRAVAAWLPDLALLAGLALAWRYRRSWGRPLLFAAGYFIVSLLPVLGFADISFMKYSLVADPWQYVAIIGVIALAAAAGVRAWERLSPTPQKQVVIGLVILVGALGVLTWRRCDVFENDETLWRDTLQEEPALLHSRRSISATRCWRKRDRRGTLVMAQAEVQAGHLAVTRRLCGWSRMSRRRTRTSRTFSSPWASTGRRPNSIAKCSEYPGRCCDPRTSERGAGAAGQTAGGRLKGRTA